MRLLGKGRRLPPPACTPWENAEGCPLPSCACRAKAEGSAPSGFAPQAKREGWPQGDRPRIDPSEGWPAWQLWASPNLRKVCPARYRVGGNLRNMPRASKPMEREPSEGRPRPYPPGGEPSACARRAAGAPPSCRGGAGPRPTWPPCARGGSRAGPAPLSLSRRRRAAPRRARRPRWSRAAAPPRRDSSTPR